MIGAEAQFYSDIHSISKSLFKIAQSLESLDSKLPEDFFVQLEYAIRGERQK